MTTYAIGDVQGCYQSLKQLLSSLHFNLKTDRLWFVGDLVNRGPDSLSVLRYLYDIQDRVTVVLGNHDLHLLALYAGVVTHKSYDTIDEILAAPDADKLCRWLRHQPLLHYEQEQKILLVHAGVYPQWDLKTAMGCAQEVEAMLKSPDHALFLAHMYGNQPDHWHQDLRGWERLRFITNVFTRMRLVSEAGHLDLRKKGSPKDADQSYHPWFELDPVILRKVHVIFGHWAALECDTQQVNNLSAIDSGCVWGKTLTALRLNDFQRFSVKSVS